MYNRNILSGTFFFVLLLVVFSSCEKEKNNPAPLGDAGQTIVKFFFTDGENPNGIPDTANGVSAGIESASVEILSTPQHIVIGDLRRDVPNNTELNKTMIVQVSNDPGAVTSYDNTLSPLPYSAFVPDDANPLTGDSYTITFNPGDFAKDIKITLPDVASLDLSKKYAIGLKITSVDGDAKISTLQKTLVLRLTVKNEWDGEYHSSLGYFYHPTVPRAIPAGASKQCFTAGLNSVYTELGDFNGIAQPTTYLVSLSIDNTNHVTIGPGTGPSPSTNPVVTLTALPAGSGYTPFIGSNPSLYNNTYNPATKTFYLRYGYTNPAGLWRVIEEVLIRD